MAACCEASHPLTFLFFSGIGGNLVSIQSSRISTNLHLSYSPGDVPEDRKGCYNPCRTFIGSGNYQIGVLPLELIHTYHTHLMLDFLMAGANNRSAQILLLLVVPGQLIFLYAIHVMKGGHTFPSPLLTVSYLSASLIQVSQACSEISLFRLLQ